MSGDCTGRGLRLSVLIAILFGLVGTTTAWAIDIDSASWSNFRNRLTVRGDRVPDRSTVTIAYPDGTELGTTQADGDGDWTFRITGLDPVPCRVRGIDANGGIDERNVRRAPNDCSNNGGGGIPNVPPTASANGPYTGTTGVAVTFNSAGSTDSDGNIASFEWNFGDGTTSTDPNPSHSYAAAGTYTVTLTVTDDAGDTGTDTTSAAITDQPSDNLPPTANANGPYSATPDVPVNFSSAGSTDSDGNIVSFEWNFGDGNTSTDANPSHSYAAAGTYDVTLTVTDNDGGVGSDSTTATIEDNVANCIPATPGVSINSTSQSGCPDGVVAEQDSVPNASYSVLAINDLGMHCGDLDTRIASILPPFQVLLAQVIQKGAVPSVNPAGVDVFYSAASNPNDPALALTEFDGLMDNGETYKTNFWDFPVPAGTYDPFYPAYNPLQPAQTLTPLAGPPFNVTADTGLPVPNVEKFYIGDDRQVGGNDVTLEAVLHAMPGITGPYTVNGPKLAQEHYLDKPFFINFPFGYVAANVNWYEGAGTPFAAFDDNGRENAYPLVRVEARNAAGATVSTVDTVLPISGEASCTNCHADPADVQNSRTAAPTQALTTAGLPVALSMDDPNPNLPNRVSVEYAADINVLRLHDLTHGANYVAPSPADDGTTVAAACDISANDGNGDANCLTNKALVQNEPVVCQVCHYTPALDLAHLGPLTGPEGGIANGRNQLSHQSNSRVMHNHHGQFSNLFTPIPAPTQNAQGVITNQAQRLAALEDSCYQCHPGTNVQCLRGAMFNGGMLCSDCHGSMEQVGADFSAGVSPENPGAFVLDQGNFYDPNSNQPRVPWANEPGCGSCHTGDASNRLTGAGLVVNTVDTNGNTDGIRLRQAWVNGDDKATPIVPTNKRFAEPAVPATFNGFANPGAGNPQLYRVSTGHGGVMCEGCHGATHAEWPNANPNSNDNITASQLQGHTGTIIECSTCHGTGNLGNTLDGPHGMHPVGNDTNVSSGSAAGPRVGFVDGGHEDLAEGNSARCAVCHGSGSRGSNQGTVLSVAKKDRRLDGQTIPAGTPIGCSICHGGGD